MATKKKIPCAMASKPRPGAMLTVGAADPDFKVPMSPRQQRLWTFLQKERGIYLNDWSTDLDVARNASALTDAANVLAERIKKAPGDRDLAALARDLESIRRRDPSARVDETAVKKQTAKAKAAPAPVVVEEPWVSELKGYY